MTEDGTMKVMRLAEIIQDNRAKAAKELAAVVSALEAVDCRTLATRLGKTANELAQDDKHLMDIMTALSFQELGAQPVKNSSPFLRTFSASSWSWWSCSV
jgi:chemotaxis protein CheZ